MISWEDKFDPDVEYVDNISSAGDWKIIFLATKKAFFKKGIGSDTSVSMKFFEGSKVKNNDGI